MTRDELVAALSQELNFQKKDIEEILVAALEKIMGTLKTGERVTLSGFGQFSVAVRSARASVNPRNPTERIQIPAVRVVKFRTGKRLKDCVKENSRNGIPVSRDAEI